MRTSNPIESTFATVRHRTTGAKGRLSNATALAVVSTPLWRCLDGHNQLPKVVLCAEFKDGL